MGTVVILSNWEVVFQPRKIERSGLLEAVGGNVFMYIHKEQKLDDVEHRYHATHDILIDDKLRILSAVKTIWASRVATVFSPQGHYAIDRQALTRFLPADVTITHIGNLLSYDLLTRLMHREDPNVRRIRIK